MSDEPRGTKEQESDTDAPLREEDVLREGAILDDRVDEADESDE